VLGDGSGCDELLADCVAVRTLTLCLVKNCMRDRAFLESFSDQYFNDVSGVVGTRKKHHADSIGHAAIQSEDQCSEVIARLPKIPVLLNMVPGGRTPIVTNDRANEIGFRLVIWPTLALEAVVPAVEKALQAMKKTGKTPEDQSMGPGALFEVCGLRDLMAFDESVGGRAYNSS